MSARVAHLTPKRYEACGDVKQLDEVHIAIVGEKNIAEDENEDSAEDDSNDCIIPKDVNVADLF